MKTKYSKRFLKEAKNLRKKLSKIDEDLLKFVTSLEKDSLGTVNKGIWFQILVYF